MLDWLVIGGLTLVFGLLADDWYANRPRRPLSQMKPNPKSLKTHTGMEELDMTRAQQHIARSSNKQDT